MTTKDVIEVILDNYPQIKYLHLVEFGSQKDVKKNSIIWSETDEELYNTALKFRKTYGLPFWPSLMLSNINSLMWSKVCMDACLQHNNIKYKKISASEFLKKDFSDETFGISSKVILHSSDIMHIPFIDFHIPISDTGTEIVEYICSIINKTNSGFIINSGNSYHYIGNCLFTKLEMLQFLSKANLFAPITDSIWISHQIYEQSCTLRLGKKKGVLPVVIKKLSTLNETR